MLLLRLIAAAHERGISHFQCLVLAGNRSMLDLVHRVVPGSVDHPQGREVLIDAPLGEEVLIETRLPEVAVDQPVASRPGPHPLYTILRHSATGALEVLSEIARGEVEEVYTALRGAAEGVLEVMHGRGAERTDEDAPADG